MALRLSTALGHRAQRLHPKAQTHGGKFAAEFVQRLHHQLGRQHHIHHQAHFGLQPLGQAAGLGDKPVQRHCQSPPVGEDGAARLGQAGFAGAGAQEQAEPQLAFQMGDGIAHRRGGAAQLAAGGGKAAGLHDRQEDGNLVQRGRLGLHDRIS